MRLFPHPVSYSYWNSNPVDVTLESVTNATRPAPSWKVTLVGIVVPQNLRNQKTINTHTYTRRVT